MSDSPSPAAATTPIQVPIAETVPTVPTVSPGLIVPIDKIFDFYDDSQKEFMMVLCVINAFITTNKGRRLFYKSHSIDFKYETGIWKVKYDALCRFAKMWQLACRGTTIYDNTNVRFALSKFFNMGRELKDHLGIDINDVYRAIKHGNLHATAALKRDGSYIQAQVHPITGDVHVMTQGAITAHVMQACIDGCPTFDKKFCDLVGPAVIAYIKSHPEYSFIFELCTALNPIVTKYDVEFVEFLTIIDTATGTTYWDPQIITELATLGVQTTTMWPISNDDPAGFVANLMDNELPNNPDKYGENPEGIVLYLHKTPLTGSTRIASLPFGKGKRPAYFADHKFVLLNPGTLNALEKVVQPAVLAGTDDDLPYDVQRDHAATFRTFIVTICGIIDPIFAILREISISNPVGPMRFSKTHEGDDQTVNKTFDKLYAMEVQKQCRDQNLPTWMAGFLYAMRPLIRAGAQEDAWQLFTSWLLTKKMAAATDDKIDTVPTNLETLQRGSYSVGDKIIHWFDLETANVKSAQSKSSVPIDVTTSRVLTKIVIVDFDATFVDTSSAPTGYKGDWWADRSSLGTFQLYQKTVDLVKSYEELGYRIVFLTGRKVTLVDRVLAIAQTGLPEITSSQILCTPLDMGTIEYKTWVVRLFSSMRDIQIVHLDDDLEVLKACSTIPFEVKYLPVWVNHTRQYPFISGIASAGRLAGFCLPPGAGKSSVRTELETLYDGSISRISTDMFVRAKVDELMASGKATSHGEATGLAFTALGPQFYMLIQNAITTALGNGNLGYLDMCNDQPVNKNGKGSVTILTYMPTIDGIKSKSKPLPCVSPHFLAWCVRNVLRRTTTNHDDSSLLGDKPAKIFNIVLKKAQSCVGQITNPARNIISIVDWWNSANDKSTDAQLMLNAINGVNTLFNKKGVRTDEVEKQMKMPVDQFVALVDRMANIVDACIPPPTYFAKELLNRLPVNADSMPNGYVALGVPATHISQFNNEISSGFTPIAIPHVTIVPPRSTQAVHNKFIGDLGKKFKVTVNGLLRTNDIVTLTVHIHHDQMQDHVTHGHITLAVRGNTRPIEALRLLESGGADITPIDNGPTIDIPLVFL